MGNMLYENELIKVYAKLYNGVPPNLHLEAIDHYEAVMTLDALAVMQGDIVIKECSCGRKHTISEWFKLPMVGYQSLTGISGELRNCMCGSTICLTVRRGIRMYPKGIKLFRGTIYDGFGQSSKPPFSVQQCINLTIAAQGMIRPLPFSMWTEKQFLEAAHECVPPTWSQSGMFQAVR